MCLRHPQLIDCTNRSANILPTRELQIISEHIFSRYMYRLDGNALAGLGIWLLYTKGVLICASQFVFSALRSRSKGKKVVLLNAQLNLVHYVVGLLVKRSELS